MPDTDIVLARPVIHYSVPTSTNAPRYIHTRWPSPAQTTANALVAAMVVLAGGTLGAGFTGHLAVDSPVTAVLIAVLFTLAVGAWVAHDRATQAANGQGAPR